MSSPVVTIKSNSNILEFTLNTNVSIANAIRRILLSEIPVIGCITFPHNKNQCIITKNTTRFTNEMIKQRISCIPIHIVPGSIEVDNLEVRCKKENKTNTITYVTSEDFKLYDIETNKEIKLEEPAFPPDPITGDYCDLVRLRPEINEIMPGEQLELSFKMTVTNAKNNGCFNAVSKATYKNTENLAEATVAWNEHSKKNKNLTDIDKKNWFLTKGKKFYVPNSFDFKVETIGVLSNTELLKVACKIMLKKLNSLKSLIDENNIEILESESTIKHAHDIKLVGEDYTLGKVLEYIIYDTHFEGDKSVSYVGFKKYHPHDDYSILRIAFNDESNSDTVIKYLLNTIAEGLNQFQTIIEQI